MKSVTGFVGALILSIMIISGCEKNIASGQSGVQIPAHPLNSTKDLDVLINQIGDARIVLLGEASHGTAEYYDWRSEISKRLIQEKGFNIIAVEGEWADSYRVNQFIKGPQKDSTAAIALLQQYDRWPTWMWGNYQVASLVTWLNQYNQAKSPGGKVGFFGLDVYCIWESLQELMPLVRNNENLHGMAQKALMCFQPFSADPMDYAYSVYNASATCRTQTERLWEEIFRNTGGKTATNEEQFVMQQNALVALNGERYYRASVKSFDDSWNIRDNHMNETVNRLMMHHGPNAKMIIWEHNTHIGDARFTDMARGGMVNVGQLVRQDFGRENVYIVGFGSNSGTVIASPNWGGPIQTMMVPNAQRGSWEELLHRQGATNKILFSNELRKLDFLQKSIGHRAIGVQYNPSRENGNYVPSIIPDRYDAFIYIDKTSALRPLGTKAKNEPPDTYPSGY